ncbi:MAG TPA: hypothetical protein VLB09_04255 [Nitrospiria bacterium]|nr:hypothetical protein [Nitrospiria bacterium]
MSIGDILKSVVSALDESRGVGVVGMDGILVEEQKKDGELDLQALGAEFCGLIKTAETALENLGTGPTGEMIINTEGAILLVKRVNPEYFLLLVTRPDCNIGKGRFLLRRFGEQLKKEL